jgi:tetratricopeptide (TPR) repeat protein
MASFNDLLVVPYSELLNSIIGLSEHRGGPVFPHWDLEVRARHCRRGWQPVDDPPKVGPEAPEFLPGRWAWIGPVCHHFGHQVADFSMRILPARASGYSGGYLAAVRAGQPASMSAAPKFFLDILDYCGVDPARVHLVNRPTRVEQLLIFDQAEMIFGPPPTPEWLAELERHYHESTRSQQPFKPGSIVYVTRSRIARGTIAGELEIDRLLRKKGVQVVHPEDHGLHTLLPLYVSAEHVVFSEGSAMHALQFLGRQLRHVTIVGRGQSLAFGKNFLAPRCESLVHVDAVSGGISGRADGRFREGGLAMLDADRLLTALRLRLGIDAAGWDEAAWQQAQQNSVRRWLIEHVHARPNPAVADPDVIEREASQLGLTLDVVSQRLLQARRHQQAGQWPDAAICLQRVYHLLPSPTTAALALDATSEAGAHELSRSVLSAMDASRTVLGPGSTHSQVRALIDIGQPEAAQEIVRQLLASPPPTTREARPWALLSVQMWRSKATELAHETMRRALVEGQLSTWMLLHWVHVKRALGWREQAEQLVAQALAAEPEHPDALFLQILLLVDAGQRVQALRQLEHALTLHSRPAWLALRNQLSQAPGEAVTK